MFHMQRAALRMMNVARVRIIGASKAEILAIWISPFPKDSPSVVESHWSQPLHASSMVEQTAHSPNPSPLLCRAFLRVTETEPSIVSLEVADLAEVSRLGFRKPPL